MSDCCVCHCDSTHYSYGINYTIINSLFNYKRIE